MFLARFCALLFYFTSPGQSYIAGCVYFCPDAILLTIYNKTEDQPEENGFTWNISSFDLIQVDTSSFWMYSTVGNDSAGAASEAFNISDKEVAPVVVGTTSSATSPASSSTVLESSSLTSEPTSSSSLPPSLPSSSTTPTPATQKSSQNPEDAYIGIGAGLAALALLIITGLVIQSRRRNRRNPETNLLLHTSTASEMPGNDNFEVQSSIARSELSAGLHDAWSKRSTVVTKFELPGNENEMARSRAVYELPVNPFELAAN